MRDRMRHSTVGRFRVVRCCAKAAARLSGYIGAYTRVPLVREAGGTYLIGAGDSGNYGSDAGTPPNGLDRIVRPASGVEVSTSDVPTHLSRDGACVASLASASELDIVDALTGVTTKIALPAAADPESWTSTWVPGDDAVFVVP